MLPNDVQGFPVRDLPDFIRQTLSISPKNRLFRGHSDDSWELRPKAGRQDFFINSNLTTEQNPSDDEDLRRFAKWRNEAVAHTPHPLPEGDLECLAYAQHYGLATRLLDWTTNPLVALFFAVETHPKEDAAVYCYLPRNAPLDPGHKLTEPVSGIRVFIPRPFDLRISNQQGVFTYHPKPVENFLIKVGQSQAVEIRGSELVPVAGVENLSEPFAFTVPAALKPMLMRQLSEMSVSRKFLFPGLDGLSSFINWENQVDRANLNRLGEQLRQSHER